MIFSTLCPCSVHDKCPSVAKSAKKMRKYAFFASMHSPEDLNGTEIPLLPT